MENRLGTNVNIPCARGLVGFSLAACGFQPCGCRNAFATPRPFEMTWLEPVESIYIDAW